MPSKKPLFIGVEVLVSMAVRNEPALNFVLTVPPNTRFDSTFQEFCGDVATTPSIGPDHIYRQQQYGDTTCCAIFNAGGQH